MNNNTVQLWDDTYRGRKAWRAWPYEYALAALPADFAPGSVLDIGCGLGDGLLLCQERWPEARLMGIDFSEVGLATARERLPDATFIKVDLRRLEPDIPRADLVLCCETLEHFDLPWLLERRLRESALRALVVTVPHAGRVNAHHVSSFIPQRFESRGYRTALRPHVGQPRDSVIVAVYEVPDARADG